MPIIFSTTTPASPACQPPARIYFEAPDDALLARVTEKVAELMGRHLSYTFHDEAPGGVTPVVLEDVGPAAQPVETNVVNYPHAAGAVPGSLLLKEHPSGRILTDTVPAIQGEMSVQLGCGAEPPGIQALMCVISSLRDIARFSDEEGGELMSALCALRDWAHAQIVAAPQPSTTAQSADSVQEDAALWLWLAEYLVGTRTDLDDEIVASETVNDLRKLVEAARKKGAR